MLQSERGDLKMTPVIIVISPRDVVCSRKLSQLCIYTVINVVLIIDSLGELASVKFNRC